MSKPTPDPFRKKKQTNRPNGSRQSWNSHSLAIALLLHVTRSFISTKRVVFDQVHQFLKERFITNTHEFLVDRQPLIWLLATLIGALVGIAAIAFRSLIGFMQLPWLGTTSESVATAASQTPWLIILLTPALGGLLVGIILEKWVPGRRAHSIADVIESTSVRGCRIDPKTGIISAGLAALSIGTGASVGREGPMVHLGTTISAYLLDWFSLNPSAQRTLIGCGAAAAVSASFNAPIAGVIFAHEVILRHYAIRALVPIVISSVVGGVIARMYFGNFPAFNLPDYQITSTWEFPAFALLGLTCAVVAIIFQLVMMATEQITWRIELPIWLRTSLGGLFVGAVALMFPQVLGLGYETTDAALSQKLSLGLLIALIFVKTATTAVSLACRLAGGIFSPSLYLGAMTGAAFGLIATNTFPQVGASQGLYAILGMGAVAGAVLGAPLSTILIIFELTGGYTMTIALMLTVSISVGLSHAYLGRSYFFWQLEKRGMFLHQGPHQSITRRITVADFMTPLEPISGSFDTDHPDNETGEPRKQPVIEDKEQPRLVPTDTLKTALRMFDTEGIAHIPVVAPHERSKIIGWVDRITALHTFNSELIDAHVEAHR